jgi:hypothetical protein
MGPTNVRALPRRRISADSLSAARYAAKGILREEGRKVIGVNTVRGRALVAYVEA